MFIKIWNLKRSFLIYFYSENTSNTSTLYYYFFNIKFNGEVEEHEGTDRSDKAIRDQLGDGWDPSMTISY